MNIAIIAAAKKLGMKAYMKLSKYSPEIAIGAGIACGIAAVVTACVASRKVDAILDEAHKELDEIQIEMDRVNITAGETKDLQKKAINCYTKTGWRLVKLYAPTAILTVAATGLTLRSHGILKSRYLGTLAAYEALDGAYKGYRKRVAEILGEETEKVVALGAKAVDNVNVERDDGVIENLKGAKLVQTEGGKSPYEFDFNRNTSPLCWDPNPVFSEAFLRARETYFNDIFRARGHVFLNEVLDELGLERTPAGAVCGWVRGAGDDYIDFGYMESYLRDSRQDTDLCRKNIHLNFNCDGPIWDLI